MTVFTAAAGRLGARRSLPLVIGLTPFGMVAGVLAQAHGLSFSEAALMSGLCFAGSAQILSLGQWAMPAPVLAVAFTTLVVNMRLALMGPVLAPWLDGLRGWRLWGSLFVMVDHNWALSVEAMRRNQADAAFLFGSGVVLWAAWLVTSSAGYLLGSLIQPPPGHPVFFAALAVFIALLTGLWRGLRDSVPWVVAAVVSMGVAHVVSGSWYIVAGALVGSAAGLARDGRRAA